MKKVYIQPEAELLSLALLEDFLTGSTEEPSDEDVTVGGSTNTGSGEGSGDSGATDDFVSGGGSQNPGGQAPGGDEWEDDTPSDWN